MLGAIGKVEMTKKRDCVDYSGQLLSIILEVATEALRSVH